MHDVTIEQLERMRGAPVLDSGGEKIGKVEEIFYDEGTGRPEWIGIGTGFFGTKRVLVPVQGASAEEDGFTVAYGVEQVKDSPDIDSEQISVETENELYAYYGLRGASQPAQGVTRSEEELQVAKREVEAGRVRLRKWVETEPVALEIDLQRETARVTREKIDEPVGEHEFSDEQVEVPLHAEQPVVQKQTVAKERIAVDKGVETERQTVADELRKERVGVEEGR